MRRSLAYNPSSGRYHGRDSSNYPAYFTEFERTPPDSFNLPCYPHQHVSFHDEDCYEGLKANHKHQDRHHKPKFQESVEVTEYERTTDYHTKDRSREVHEESIDMEADNFILEKHKAFERSKSVMPMLY